MLVNWRFVGSMLWTMVMLMTIEFVLKGQRHNKICAQTKVRQWQETMQSPQSHSHLYGYSQFSTAGCVRLRKYPDKII